MNVKLPIQHHSRYKEQGCLFVEEVYWTYDCVEAHSGKVAYGIDLPSWLNEHLVFHVYLLKPSHENVEDPTRGRTYFQGLSIQC